MFEEGTRWCLTCGDLVLKATENERILAPEALWAQLQTHLRARLQGPGMCVAIQVSSLPDKNLVLVVGGMCKQAPWVSSPPSASASLSVMRMGKFHAPVSVRRSQEPGCSWLWGVC